MRGIIALDIDGTITDGTITDGTVTTESQSIPKEVIAYLTSLEEQGWSLLFVTGRTYAYGYQTLKDLPCPYTYSCYNGAITLKMPDASVIARHYVLADLLPNLVEVCNRVGFDPLVHTGVEFGDYCYYRPEKFDAETRAYLEKRRTATNESWVSVQGFGPLKLKAFAYAKVFGPRDALVQIQEGALSLGMAANVIRDPLRPGYAAIVMTHGDASKGGAVRDHRRRLEKGLVVIAAGDDENDLSMLEEADIAIAMGDAPESLKAVADITAPSAKELGILKGLEEAIA